MFPGSRQSTAAFCPCCFFFFFALALESPPRHKTERTARLASRLSPRFRFSDCTIKTPVREENQTASVLDVAELLAQGFDTRGNASPPPPANSVKHCGN